MMFDHRWFWLMVGVMTFTIVNLPFKGEGFVSAKEAVNLLNAAQLHDQALATNGSASTGVIVLGVSAVDTAMLVLVAGNIREGSLAHFDDGDGIVIGRQLANKLGIRVGEKITLITPKGEKTQNGVVPRLNDYRVNAIFETGRSDYDTNLVLMPISRARIFFREQ